MTQCCRMLEKDIKEEMTVIYLPQTRTYLTKGKLGEMKEITYCPLVR